MSLLLKPASLVTGGFFYVLLSACSSIPLQSDSLLHDPPAGISQHIELTETPFNPQLDYQCGPAALAALLQNNHLKTTAEELVPEVYLPERKGSLQLELVAAARKYNQLPYVIEKKLLYLLQELEAGNPVLVLQNLALEWYPQWHYAVVVGYDLSNDEIILRSGQYRRHINSFALFERTWRRANYWGMVVLPLDKLPQTATPFRYLKAAVAFEKLGKLEQAEQAYSTALKKWPEDKHLLMAMGNINYRLNNLAGAEKYYRQLVKMWPDYAPALNNLADIEFSKGNFETAELYSRQAVQQGGRFKKAYEGTLEKILKARGSRH